MQDVWEENHKYLKPSTSHYSCCCSKHVMLIVPWRCYLCHSFCNTKILLRKVHLLQDLFSKATDRKIFKYGIMIKGGTLFHKLNTSYWEAANQHEECVGYPTGYPHDLPALSPLGHCPVLHLLQIKGIFIGARGSSTRYG